MGNAIHASLASTSDTIHHDASAGGRPGWWRVLGALILLNVGSGVRADSIYATPYTFTTIAGNVGAGSADGSGGAEQFTSPTALARDSSGNCYVTEAASHTIRKITPAGVVTTIAGAPGVAGYADGAGADARFSYPAAVAVDPAGNLYVGDAGNNLVRKVTPDGTVTTLAGQPGTPGHADGKGAAAHFNVPDGLVVDDDGVIYVADEGNATIRRISPDGVVTTLAGRPGTTGDADGAGGAARFRQPNALALDYAGVLYVADWADHAIRKIAPTGMVTTLARDAVEFGALAGIAVDASGTVYVTDRWGNAVRRVSASGVVTTLAGQNGTHGAVDGIGRDARFFGPSGIVVDGAGGLCVADSSNHILRKITAAGKVSTWVGTADSAGSTDGEGRRSRFRYPAGLAIDAAGNLYVADNGNHTIRQIDAAGVTTTLAGAAGVEGSSDGSAASARFSQPTGVAVDAAGNLYVADAGNSTIRKIAVTGVVTTLAGTAGLAGSADGTGAAARFLNPMGVAVTGDGTVYVADTGNNTIRRITAAGIVTTLAGKAGVAGSVNGQGANARFTEPRAIAVDDAGTVYVSAGKAIREITPAGTVTTLAGNDASDGWTDATAGAATFSEPAGLAVDATGIVYVTDAGTGVVRAIQANGAVTTLAGVAPLVGFHDGTGSEVTFTHPFGLAVDGAGVVYVADTENNVIRRGRFEAPRYTGTSAISVALGQPCSLALTFAGAPTVYAASALPDGLVFDATTATISGTPAGTGTTMVEVTATNAAGSTTTTLALTVEPALPAYITLGPLAGLEYDGHPREVGWMTTPYGLTVDLTYDGSADAPVNAGSYTVVGTITTPGYTGSVTETLVIDPATQRISFSPVPLARIGQPVALQAMASSGLPVSYQVLSGPATIDGATMTPSAVGTVVVRASQAGDGNYLPAADVDQTIIVKPLHDPPTISSISSQTTQEDKPTAAIAFVVADTDTAATSLKVTATSSNPALIPPSKIVLGGSGANRTVKLTPAANASGKATITLTVDDGSSSASTHFTITVTAVNDAPTITRPADVAIAKGASRTIAFKVADVETAATSLTLTRASSNPTLLPAANLVLGGSGANRTLKITPVATKTGTTIVTLTAADPGGGKASTTFKVTVESPPAIAAIADQTTNEDTTTASIAVKLGDTDTATTKLTLSATSSNPALVPANAFAFGGSGANRTLKIKPGANRTGTATITLTVSDGLLKANRSFKLTVRPMNDRPTISAIASQTTGRNTATKPIAFTIADAETAASKLTLTKASSNPKLLPIANIVLGGVGATRTVTLKPAPNQTGTAQVTLTVSDGQLSASRTFTLAVNAPPTITAIANQTVAKNGVVSGLRFTIGDAETAASKLTLTKASSNPTLVPVANIVPGGAGANRTVKVTPARNLTGSATITLTVSDGIAKTSTRFTVTVASTAKKTDAETSAPVVRAPPRSQVVKTGTAVTLSVQATQVTSYQWLHDEERLAGANSPVLTLSAARPVDAGSYRVKLTNAAGTTYSAVAELTVVDAHATATRSGPMLAVTQTLTVAGPADATSLALLLPDGWSYVSGATAGAASAPESGDTALLEWRWPKQSPGPIVFTYLLDVPDAAALPETLEALGEIRVNGVTTKLRFDLGLGR